MIDEFDLRLIQQLQEDGRRSYVKLGKALGVAEGTVRRRVKRLTEGEILKVAGVPNLNELGYNCINVMALQVRMANLKAVAGALAQRPAVCHLAFVTGRYDLIAIIVTRTPQELSRFIQNEISVIPGILRTETFVELDVIKGEWLEVDTTQLMSNLDVSSIESNRKRKADEVCH